MSEPQFHMVAAAPKPVAPFSHAAEAGGWVFLTGQMPTHPGDDSRPLPDGIEAQTRRVMDNLVIVLDGLGLGLSHVLSVRAYLTRFALDYEAMNLAYARPWPGAFPRAQRARLPDPFRPGLRGHELTSPRKSCRPGPASASPAWPGTPWSKSTCLPAGLDRAPRRR